MNTSIKTQVRVTRPFPFPAERVFDAWLDPKSAAKWLFATSEGEMVRAEIDPRVGGRYTFVDRRNGKEVEHAGEYLEIDRPRRLVFTFGVPKHSAEFERVTVDISPRGTGCELTLTTETTREFSHRSQFGWSRMMENLAARMGERRAETNLKPGESTEPGKVRLVRLLPGPIERVWEYLTDAEKRSRWFAGGPMELKKGGQVELHFKHSTISPDEEPPERFREVHYTGVSMIGEITQCDPPRLLAFTWEGDTPETNSEVIFELKSTGDEVEMTLTHHRLATDHELLSVSGGWDMHTSILCALLSGATPPPLWAAYRHLKRTVESD